MIKEFKPRVARKYVGTYRPRIDGWEKASGRAQYIDDIALKIRFPGMLYAKVLRSPYAHAMIKRLDLSKVEKLPGVKAILTYDDPHVAPLKPTNAGWTPGSFLVTYDRMFFPHLRDRRILSNHVCWVGDEAGVVVAAESEDIAEEALRLIDIEWEVLPFILDPVEAMKPGASTIHPEINPDGNVLPLPPKDWPLPGGSSHLMVERGDIEKAFAEADMIIEAKCTFHNTPVQGSLDNWCCLASWEGDKLTVWSNTYEADQTRLHLSEMLRIPLNKVRAIAPYVGGSFGRGDTGEQPFFIFTALLAKKTGRPVKFRHIRREEFHDTRTGEIQYCKIGAKIDGKITAAHIKIIGDAGAYADHTEGSARIVAHEWIELNLAHIPSLKAETYSVYTNRIPSSCKRGIGNIQMNWLMGLAVDKLAEELGADPLELIVKNFQMCSGALPNKHAEAVLCEGARRIGWEKRHIPGGGPTYEGMKRRGIGFSVNHSWQTSWQSSSAGPLQVTIRVNPDGTVNLEAPTIETGPGANTCCVLACAETIGVRLEDVHWISRVDTETGVRDVVQTGSRVGHILPEIIHIVALDAKRKLLELAAPEFGVTPEEMDIEEGRIHVKAALEKSVTIKDLLCGRDLVPLLSCGTHYLSGKMTGVPYAATFAEVEVDTETGEINMLKLVVCNDCGTVMYPSAAEAQQLGGQAMAIGEVLTEEIIYDKATGVPLNFNWIDYKIPTMADFPDVEPVLMEVWKGAGEYGACGIGESVVTCTPRAVANAVYNAIGVRINETPITPDKVLKALGKI